MLLLSNFRLAPTHCHHVRVGLVIPHETDRTVPPTLLHRAVRHPGKTRTDPKEQKTEDFKKEETDNAVTDEDQAKDSGNEERTDDESTSDEVIAQDESEEKTTES